VPCIKGADQPSWRIVLFAQSRQVAKPQRPASNYIDDATRAALDKIIGIKGQIAAVDARLAAADRETAEIGSDQDRLRENIKVLSEKSEARQLVARYVAKAGEQETRLEQIVTEGKAAAAERARLQSDLDLAIRALAVDRKL
jgi:hypothetical protein